MRLSARSVDLTTLETRLTAARALMMPSAVVQVDIRLDGGETQVLDQGVYILWSQSDVYGASDWNAAGAHIEYFGGAAWRDLIIDLVENMMTTVIYSDGTTMRAANGAAPGTWRRVIGVRVY